MQFVYIQISLVVILAGNVQNNMQWIIESKSVVFGEDVHLKCNGNACEPKTIKKWIGGPGYNVLCFDDYSADNSKYEMMVNSTTGYFILIIHNLTGNDINFRYTCACGFHQFTKVLDVADTFIYPPDVGYSSHQSEEGKYKVELQMDVYPLPTCDITIEGTVIPVNIIHTPTSHSYRMGELQLLNVTINNTIDLGKHSCKGNFTLKCNVGKRNYTLINQDIDVCTEITNSEGTINTMIAVLVIVVLSLLIVVTGLILRCKSSFSYSMVRNPSGSDLLKNYHDTILNNM